MFVLANTEATQTFDDFLNDIKKKAIAQNISQQTLDKVFSNLTPNPKVIEYDRRQPEFTQTFWEYLNKRVSNIRIKKGKNLYKQHYSLLKKIEKKYGVQGQFLIAFWGLETNFGKYIGELKIVRSLATLAYDNRRRAFFTKQLLALLKLIDDKKIPFDVKGSWAGAMGWTQFMPTNVQAYAIDENKNKKLDLWSSVDDVFASSSNFLRKIGWKKGEKWGREVSLPKDFDYRNADLKIKKSLQHWHLLGVRKIDGSELPNIELEASLVLPMGYKGPAFLVYQNFRAILNWNRSILYAIAVGHLSDRILGLGKLKTPITIEKKLSKKDIQFIQTRLNSLGFDVGKVDGIAGPKTRDAVREFQLISAFPADGFVGYSLLQQLQ
ncbi:Membrane-bound lytic murein transglycosylase B precursor [hydrothermal vent metagenome]|uniref:Membrane-bound lytic murein transglycosylase B n=1 Tax=hydrothermal vent metagenome TaxID=652676 RepID=A0A1W1C5Y4_9ZZZZ